MKKYKNKSFVLGVPFNEDLKGRVGQRAKTKSKIFFKDKEDKITNNFLRKTRFGAK